MPTYILGISAFYHDSAAALVRDGEVLAAAQEERFTRQKGDPGFPAHAMEFCLRTAGITVADVDRVVFYEKPLVKYERAVETYLTFSPAGFASFRSAAPRFAHQMLKAPQRLARELGPDFRGTIHFVDHHEAHAASAFFPSPFEEAAVLTLDAVGEWSTSSIGVGRGNRLTLTHETRFPHSLGMLYSAFTYYTGFKVNSGEYKVMGLAPYGTPTYRDVILEKIVKVQEDGSFWLDMSYFNYCQGLTMTSDKFHALFGGKPRSPESLLTQKDMDLAASVQAVCEEIVIRAATHVHHLTQSRHLVLAGGVALNCVANGKLLRQGPFDRIWVQPAAGDAGGALGSALLAWHHDLDQPRRVNPRDSQRGSFLGPEFDADDIELFLDSTAACYERIDDEAVLLDRVARLIGEEKIIGWFHGRMEYGPRSLGGRSILGDSRSPRMQQNMNLKIKFRESFRPFAPCVLAEHAHEIFEMQPDEESPYMLMVAPVRDEWRLPIDADSAVRMQDPDLRVRVSVPRSSFPAITHVDYSARVQTVDAERHGRFYRLMRRFHDLTGCPVLVNTSFNIRGEPIVCTPQQAYHCFMGTDIDCLVLGNYLLLKERQPAGLSHDARAYMARYELD